MQKSRTPHENMTPSELDDLYIKMQGEAKTLLLRPCYDRLVEGSKLIQLRRREAMIDAGKFDPNIYIVKNGMVASHLHGQQPGENPWFRHARHTADLISQLLWRRSLILPFRSCSTLCCGQNLERKIRQAHQRRPGIRFLAPSGRPESYLL